MVIYKNINFLLRGSKEQICEVENERERAKRHKVCHEMLLIILSNNGNKLGRYNPLKGYLPKFFFVYLILLRLSTISRTESILLNMTIYFPDVFPLNRSPQVSGRIESCPSLFLSFNAFQGVTLLLFFCWCAGATHRHRQSTTPTTLFSMLLFCKGGFFARLFCKMTNGTNRFRLVALRIVCFLGV